MNGRQIILDHINGREAAALMVDGQLDDLLIESDAPRAGTIYRAIADRPVKGQGGMFVKTPDGSAFLRQVKGLAPGDRILVQVTGMAEPGKAIPVTQKVLFKSRYAIVTPGAPGLNVSRSIRDDDARDALLAIAHAEAGEADVGLILRSACEGAPEDEIAEDVRAMLDLCEAVMADVEGDVEMLSEGDGPHVAAWRDWSEPADVVTEAGSFETHGVLDALEAADGDEVALGSGAYMYVEPTRALVAVDVNTGRDTSPAAGTKANFAMAKLLPRALRVRGLGGQIVLDLAPMAKKDRRGFEATLRAALKRDVIDTTLVGFTPLGHYELQRKNARTPLTELLK
ncbi:ribonuclease E/G [Shimia sp. NS0008-38b]|uniref:ribonuclease E/G n=1 Tax=Shimia sp. NS0008-38b TaxID=3127653 RepID=UPI00310895BF